MAMRERGVFCFPGERRFVVAGVFFFVEWLLAAGFTAVFATFRAGALPADTFFFATDFFATDLLATPVRDGFFVAAALVVVTFRAGALVADFFDALVAADFFPDTAFFTVAFPPAAFFADDFRGAPAAPDLRAAVRTEVFPAAGFPAGFFFADVAFEAAGFAGFLLSALLLLATVILSSP